MLLAFLYVEMYGVTGQVVNSNCTVKKALEIIKNRIDNLKIRFYN